MVSSGCIFPRDVNYIFADLYPIMVAFDGLYDVNLSTFATSLALSL